MTPATTGLLRQFYACIAAAIGLVLSGCAITEQGELCYVTSSLECQIMTPQRGVDGPPPYQEYDAVSRNDPYSNFVNPTGTWEKRSLDGRFRYSTYIEFSALNGNIVTGYDQFLDTTTFWDYDGDNTWYARGPDEVVRLYDSGNGQVWMPNGESYSLVRVR